MINAQRQRVEQEMTSLVDNLDRSYLRKMQVSSLNWLFRVDWKCLSINHISSYAFQAQMHNCAAKCCNDEGASMESVQRCVENCSQPVNKAQRYVQTELERLIFTLQSSKFPVHNYFSFFRVQGKLQRCVMDCNDSIKDKMGPNPTETEISKYTNEFERCAIKCVDSQVDALPSLFKSIKAVLSRGPNSIPDV